MVATANRESDLQYTENALGRQQIVRLARLEKASFHSAENDLVDSVFAERSRLARAFAFGFAIGVFELLILTRAKL